MKNIEIDNKYIENLLNPEELNYGYPDGLNTAKIQNRKYFEINFNQQKYGLFGIYLNILSCTANHDRNAFYLDSTYSPFTGTTYTPTDIDLNTSYVADQFFKKGSMYRIPTARIKYNFNFYSSTNNFENENFKINLAVLNTDKYTTNFSNFANFSNSETNIQVENNGIFNLVNTEFPISFLPYDFKLKTDNLYDKKLYILYFDLPEAAKFNTILKIEIIQNIEILSYLSPLVGTLNCYLPVEKMNHDIKKISKEINIYTYDKQKNYFINFKSDYSEKHKHFFNKKEIYKLPLQLNTCKTILMKKKFKFSIQNNSSGNFFYMFNPYYSFEASSTSNLSEQLNNTTIDFNSTNSFSSSSYLNLNTFFNENYISLLRLVKGYVILTNETASLKTTGNNIVALKLVKINNTGAVCTLQYDTNEPTGSLNFIYKSQSLIEKPSSDQINFSIPPSYWNNYQFVDPNSPSTKFTGDNLTGYCIICSYGGTALKKNVIDIELFYECVMTPYNSSSATNKANDINIFDSNISHITENELNLNLASLNKNCGCNKCNKPELSEILNLYSSSNFKQKKSILSYLHK